MVEGMKTCPFCAEDINAQAVKCKHCHSMLEETKQEKEAPLKQSLKQTMSKGPIWMRWWVWAAVIILFLFIAIVGSGGGDDEPAPETIPADDTGKVIVFEPQEPEPEPEPESELKLTLIGIGETTTFAEWEYKVIDVEYHKTLKDERARGIYAVFMLEATNNSNVPRGIKSMFQVEDDQSRVFAFDGSASLAHHHTFRNDIWHHEDIGASFTGIMPIAFDVADDVKILYFYPRDIRDEEFDDTAVIMVEVER